MFLRTLARLALYWLLGAIVVVVLLTTLLCCVFILELKSRPPLSEWAGLRLILLPGLCTFVLVFVGGFILERLLGGTVDDLVPQARLARCRRVAAGASGAFAFAGVFYMFRLTGIGWLDSATIAAVPGAACTALAWFAVVSQDMVDAKTHSQFVADLRQRPLTFAEYMLDLDTQTGELRERSRFRQCAVDVRAGRIDIPAEYFAIMDTWTSPDSEPRTWWEETLRVVKARIQEAKAAYEESRERFRRDSAMCTSCWGAGKVRYNSEATCPRCKGKG